MEEEVSKIEVTNKAERRTNEWKKTDEGKIAEAVIPKEETPAVPVTRPPRRPPRAPSRRIPPRRPPRVPPRRIPPPKTPPPKTREELIGKFQREHKRLKELIDRGCITVERLEAESGVKRDRLNYHLDLFVKEGYTAEIVKERMCSLDTIRKMLERFGRR